MFVASAAWGRLVFGYWVYIRCCGCCRWRFRSYSDSLFQTPKSKQKALPRRTALRLGSVFPRYGAHPGASPPVCFAAPPLDVCGSAAWRCAPNPLMDTFARPAEGAKNQKPHQEPEPKPKPKQIKRSQPSAVPTGDWVYSVGVWSAIRPPSRASSFPQGDGVWSVRDWSARRPPSPAGWLLQFRERAPHAAKPPHSTQ